MSLLRAEDIVRFLLGVVVAATIATPLYAQKLPPPTMPAQATPPTPVLKQPQQEQKLFDGADLGTVLGAARMFGSAALSRQKSGAPLIIGDIDGYRYSVRFLNCRNRPACQDMNFHIGFKKPVELATINAWNSGKRFTRAYQDPEGDAILEMDATLEGGVSAQNIKGLFHTWRLSLSQFVKHIDFE